MSSTRVLFLAQLPPPHHGQSAMAATVHDVLREDLRCKVTRHWGGGARSNEDIGKRDPGKYWGLAKLLLRLVGIWARGRRFDIAYLGMAPWAHTALRDAMLGWLAGRVADRVWMHVHGEGLERIVSGRGLRERVLRRLLRGTELIAITSSTARLGRRSGLFSRVLDLPNQAPNPGAPGKLATDEFRVSCLGNLDPRKGVFDFLDCVKHARGRGVPVYASIVGGPTAALGVEDMRAKVIEAGLAGRVDVTGRVSEERKSDILGASHVFLYLSRHDLAPLALIEALAHGAIPIVLDIGGIPEMVGEELRHNVIDSAMSDEELLDSVAWRLKAYHEDPALLGRDRAAARKRYLDRYSPDRFRLALARFAGANQGRGISQ